MIVRLVMILLKVKPNDCEINMFKVKVNECHITMNMFVTMPIRLINKG
jgi:hypothetical protein